MQCMIAVALTALTAVCSWAAPVDETEYGRAVLRVEARGPAPRGAAAEGRGEREQALADAGAGARWIQMVDHLGAPYIKNPYLPCDYPDAAEHEAALKAWVDDIHAAGMAAMSWYALTFCQSGWKAHPEWRQVYIEPWRDEDFICCIESGYGDALIEYVNYAIETLGLDGIWFDGSVWTPIWERPVPLSCACEACKTKFRADTGLDLPAKQDWDDPVFRTWVTWRYDEFGAFVGRLAASIREKHPDAAVVINHYHRPGIPWQSAVPIDRYEADIISGSEAFSPDSLDLTVRLCNAYGRSQSEVWRPFSLPASPEENAEGLLSHALIAYSAGGFPSFGGDPTDPKMAPTAALMTPIMSQIHPFVTGDVVTYAALHVSQQTETFHFGRGGAGKSQIDPYWASLGHWTAALGQAHIAPEYVYDADMTAENLARFPALVMPLSAALTDAQSQGVLAYLREGGTLVLGAGAGNLDGAGLPREANPLGDALGFELDGVPSPDGMGTVSCRVAGIGTDEPISLEAARTPLRLVSGPWETLLTYPDLDDAPAAATRPFGGGRVVVVGFDPGTTFAATPVSGGETTLGISDEQAASGRYSLKYVDSATAPESFYPDLESRMVSFGGPEYVGGEFEADFRVGADAHVSVEIRSSAQPIAGPMVSLGPGGAVTAGGQKVCDLPLDQWLHLKVAYRFAEGDQPSTWEATVTLRDGTKANAMGTSPESGYRRTDWLVVYGAGSQTATFYVDNLRLTALGEDGERVPVLSRDFEEGPAGLNEPTTLLGVIAEAVKRYAPPPISIDAPAHVRMGAFKRGDGAVLVHLHNRNAMRGDWLSDDGPPVRLRCTLPVGSAKSGLTGAELAVTRDGQAAEIEVPSVGLYEVVVIEP